MWSSICCEVLLDGLKLGDALLFGVIDRLGDHVDDLEESLGVLFRETQHLANDRRRNEPRVVPRGVDLFVATKSLEQFRDRLRESSAPAD
jgi:hypothetical protein